MNNSNKNFQKEVLILTDCNILCVMILIQVLLMCIMLH